MKKIFSAVLLMFVSTALFAQLNVHRTQDALERVGTLRASYAYLYARDSTYYLVIGREAGADDAGHFALGLSAESAILTLQDLISAAEMIDIPVLPFLMQRARGRLLQNTRCWGNLTLSMKWRVSMVDGI